MGWIQKLYDTYEQCQGREPPGSKPLLPIGHTTQQAHIEIVIDEEGNFKRASILSKDDCTTLIPCTEESGGRAGSKPVNHPLCDKLQYLAGDFRSFGGEVTSGYAKAPDEPHRLYLNTLTAWSKSEFSHSKLKSILAYVGKGEIVADLVKENILPLNADKQLSKLWGGEKDQTPPIFKLMSNGQSPENAFVRWRILTPNNPVTGTWEDPELIKAWVAFYASQQTKTGLCMVNGTIGLLAVQHPAKIRHGGDKAKLISSNDTSGYTFRGRFFDADQVVGVGFEVTQKAHNALRWLVERQAYHDKKTGQVFVAWSAGGKPVPDPFVNSLQLLLEDQEISHESDEHTSLAGDVGQAFALRLNKSIAGYRAQLDPEDIVVMALDSATPGRMAITFYRELKGSDFLDRIQNWHGRFAWPQNFGKDAHFVGAPAPRDIAEAAYGRRLDDKLRKAVIERLLPCIIDAQPFPRDLLQSVVRRTSNRVGQESWEWEKCLGIACSLLRGYSLSQAQPTEYSMALEPDRTTRDYLYGRLLAIAENIEHFALTKAGEMRDTAAAKLMQRFSDRPFSTWRNIELALTPYKSRLRSSEQGAGFLYKREKLFDEILGAFDSDDFTNDTPLTAEFLLGYHCQRQKLWEKTETPDDAESSDNS